MWGGCERRKNEKNFFPRRFLRPMKISNFRNCFRQQTVKIKLNFLSLVPMLFGLEKSTVGTVKTEIFGRIKGDAVRFPNENSISLFNRLEINCYEHPRTVKNVLKFSEKRPPPPQSPFLQCSLLKMIYFPFFNLTLDLRLLPIRRGDNSHTKFQ